MKIGKLPLNALKRTVLRQIHTGREEVLSGARAGENCGVVAFSEEDAVVLTTDPITGAAERIGTLGIWAAVNDVAASGAEPVAVLVNILLPGTWNETKLKYLIAELDDAAKQAGVEIIAGHTETTRAVNRPVLTVTGVGACKKDAVRLTKNITPGMELVVTGWIGLEGTVILAREKEQELAARYAKPFLEQAKALERFLPALGAARAAKAAGAIAMHHISEGGIFGALWETAESVGVGLDIDIRQIPIRQETVEICEFFSINPYMLLSGGSLLIAAENGEAIVHAVTQAGGNAAMIGRTVTGNDRLLRCDGELRYLEPAKSDELYRVI